THAVTQFLLIEGADKNAYDKIASLIDADLKFIEQTLEHVIPIASEAEVDALIERYGAGAPKQRRDLVMLLCLQAQPLSEKAWRWFVEFISSDDNGDLGVAFRILARADSAKFGRLLAERDWSWSHELGTWTNHYGSYALTAGTMAVPFEEIAPRIAPWLLLKAV